MKKLTTLLGTLVVAGTVLGQVPVGLAQPGEVRPDALVDSPGRIAQGCIDRAKKAGLECERGIAKTTKRCVRVIRRLVEAGRLERAARVAEKCESRITGKARRCSEGIEKHCSRCTAHLEEFGEPDLAARVKEACLDVLAAVADLVGRALNAIADALS